MSRRHGVGGVRAARVHRAAVLTPQCPMGRDAQTTSLIQIIDFSVKFQLPLYSSNFSVTFLLPLYIIPLPLRFSYFLFSVSVSVTINEFIIFQLTDISVSVTVNINHTASRKR